MDSRTVTGPIDRVSPPWCGLFFGYPLKSVTGPRGAGGRLPQTYRAPWSAPRGPRSQARDQRAFVFFKRGSHFLPRFNFPGPRTSVPGPRTSVPGAGSPGQSRLNGCSDPSAAARDPSRTARAWQACTCAGFTQTIHNKNQRSTKGL